MIGHQEKKKTKLGQGIASENTTSSLDLFVFFAAFFLVSTVLFFLFFFLFSFFFFVFCFFFGSCFWEWVGAFRSIFGEKKAFCLRYSEHNSHLLYDQNRAKKNIRHCERTTTSFTGFFCMALKVGVCWGVRGDFQHKHTHKKTRHWSCFPFFLTRDNDLRVLERGEGFGFLCVMFGLGGNDLAMGCFVRKSRKKRKKYDTVKTRTTTSYLTGFLFFVWLFWWTPLAGS